uniref:Protein kinase domain-containing protein n=1 Tax=Gossypium raimondii TaxID=29730 RepID=A0A0D2V583_GOSRA|nr:hypothetical protein B456_010G036700 [Gossypium raimondii]
MRKKRKGSETNVSPEVTNNFAPTCDSRSSNIRSHYSLEDYARIKKRCKEDVDAHPIGSCKSRLAGVATAPPCGASSLVPPGRGLKRKIGCIEVITRTGRKKKIEDDYVKGDPIGQGKFGLVWLCRSKTSGVEFACKTLHKGEETVHREVEIMQHLSGHPGVVTLQAVYEEPDCFHLVMELCSGGRLIDQMAEGQYSEQRAANIFKDVMLVIKYCHEMGVVHRDIKPENILLTTSGKIKLADFGLAMRISNGQTLSGLAGSPAYVAPEVLLGNYSEKVDIWSAGVLLHALLVGVLPFQGDSLKEVFEAIKNNPVEPSVQKFNSPRSESSATSIDSGSCSQRPHLVLSSNSSSCKSEELDENGVVDVLAVAISHVRISEPKRSRLCSPPGPIEQQCSSNLTANNLCRAF